MQEARIELSRQLHENSPDTFAKVRLQRGYSQQQLATAIGTSQPHIAKIEAGKCELMLDTAKRLADALGIDLNTVGRLVSASKAQDL